MKTWWSASELAGLPGMPGTRKGVQWRAGHGHWLRRKRRARGGGWEYHVGALPRETQAHLAGASPAAPRDSSCPESVEERRRRLERWLVDFAAIPEGKNKDRARAREWVLLAWQDFMSRLGGRRWLAARALLWALATGELEPPADLARHLPSRLGQSSLYRWLKAYRERGAAGLVPRPTGRRGGVLDRPDIRKVVLGAMLKHPQITSADLRAYLLVRFPDIEVSRSTLRRWMAGWKAKNRVQWLRLTDPDAAKSRYEPAFGSQHEAVVRLNQLWEMDSTPGDWMLVDGRHTVIGVIDLYSRRLKLLVAPTSKAESVCALFRRAVLAWGVPEVLRTDNGQDYVSEHLKAVLKGLEVEQALCMPFRSEQKGTIERVFRTMSHGLLHLLDGFIGHNVAEREAIRSRQSFADRIMKGQDVAVSLTSAELQERLDQWAEHIYEQNPHQGLEGRRPAEVARAWTEPVRRVTDERGLDQLLAPVAGHRTVTKKGIRLGRRHYIAAELVVHIGERVELRRDMADAGRVYVYGEAGFICRAECPELVGISRQEIAVVARREHKRIERESRRWARDAKAAVKENIAQVVLRHRMAESAKVVPLPGRSEPYSTPALDEAGKAARVDAPPRPRERSWDQQQRFEEELAAEQAPDPKVHELDETQRQRFHRWVRTAFRVLDGEKLTRDELHWLTSYRSTYEFEAEFEAHIEWDLEVDGRPVSDVLDPTAKKNGSPADRAPEEQLNKELLWYPTDTQ